MTSGLFSGLDKAARNPSKGWRTNFLSQPEETDTNNIAEDEVLLMSPGNRSTNSKQSGSKKRCWSADVKEPHEYQAGSFKIPKITRKPQTNGCVPHTTNPDVWGFDSAFNDTSKGSRDKSYMILRQQKFGSNQLRTAFSSSRTNHSHGWRDSPYEANRHTQRSKVNNYLKDKPFDLEIDAVRNSSHQQDGRSSRFKHADRLGCWREEAGSSSDAKDGYCHDNQNTGVCQRIDITPLLVNSTEENDTHESTSTEEKVITTKEHINSNDTNNKYKSPEPLDDTQDFLVTIDKETFSNNDETKSDKAQQRKCQFCSADMELNKMCKFCGRDFCEPVVTARPPLHQEKTGNTCSTNAEVTPGPSTEEGVADGQSSNAGSFYSKANLKTYGAPANRTQHAPMLTTKRPNSIKSLTTRKKKKQVAKPVCVLISSSDEEDSQDADDTRTSRDRPSDEKTASANTSDQQEENQAPLQESENKTKTTKKQESSVTSKEDRSSTGDMNPFERDSFTAKISLGSRVMLGSLEGTVQGSLEITANQLKWKMECQEKTAKIFIDGKEITSFKIARTENPKLIVLGVTAALALKLRCKFMGNGKFLDPGSAVSAERDIVLEVDGDISDEMVADLEEWVTDILSIEFKNLSVSEAESIITQSKSYQESKGKSESSTTASRYNTRSHDTSTSTNRSTPQSLIVYPPPPQQGGITITTSDIECLKEGEFLNDVIIDFYLKYIFHEKLSEKDKERTHIFSSFFYKRLTQRRSTGDTDVNRSIPERMHSQVKTWTKYVDIFKKDFIIVPINESSHWYLAIICFPGQDGPVYSNEIDDGDSLSSSSSLDQSELVSTESKQNDEDDDEEENTSLSSGAKKTLPKKCPKSPRQIVKSCPSILVFDSLGASGRGRVTANLRSYLMHEWNHKKPNEPGKDFSKDVFKGGFPKVPEQDNHCDCGVFVLQYVESFFENPLTDYKIPIRKLDWFTQERITRKRSEIRDLIYELKERIQASSSS